MRQIAIVCLLAIAVVALGQTSSTIKVNQVGYYPSGHKSATIEEDGITNTFTLTDVATGDVVWTSTFSNVRESPLSGRLRTVIDFSEVTTPGVYILSDGINEELIEVKEHAFRDITTTAMKAFYYQRSGEEISEEYAGVYARPMGHPDDSVFVHPSAATAERPAGTVLACPGGWYDAGDYNKYIVNSAFSIGLLLCAYEQQTPYFAAINTNIPESDNALPDVLDEIMVNLRWMQTMQDTDGGVYSKLTTPSFEAFVMPIDCHQTRYVVEKTTAAALDFAACMAIASRVYRQYDGYAMWCDTALQQSLAAYHWAQEHPDICYDQAAMNALYDPDIYTGEYGDSELTDELLWAMTELWLTTQNQEYAVSSETELLKTFTIPTWDKVGGLAIYSLINNGYGDMVQSQLTDYLTPYLSSIETSAFDSPYGNRDDDFCWGSNAERCAGLGIALLNAYAITGEETYLNSALLTADYLLGRNATGYCYVTGCGTYSPDHPHHRLSAADGIVAPIPGLLVGGPNAGMQDASDDLVYPSTYSDEAYLDREASYASNEIAINWNASLVAFLGTIDANMK